MMIPLSLQSLGDYLKKKNLNVTYQSETAQLYVLIEIQKVEYPLFLRIFENSQLLQMLFFLPAQIKEGHENDVARLLHLVNREIEVPGYGMDESSKAIFYRVMLHAHEGKVHAKQIDSFIDSLENLCAMFSLPIVAVSQGQTTYKKLMEDLKKLNHE